MGSYIHEVPGTSHTSGATAHDSSPAAALSAGDSDSQGLEQGPALPMLLYCALSPPEGKLSYVQA